MPSRAQSICRRPGCNALTTSGYCDQHAKLRIAQGYGKGKTTARGYGHAWRKVRAMILRRDAYLCQACKAVGKLTPATEVDHFTPKAHGGTDAPANLRAICRECHRAKTAREWTGGAVKKSDGWGP